MTHLKPRSATFVLYQGDDLDRLAEKRRKVAIAERAAEQDSATARAGDTDAAVDTARREFDAFVDEAAERALTVELHSIGRIAFRDLVAQHPPRKVQRKVRLERALGESEEPPAETSEEVEHEDDAGYGVNTETFPEALLCYFDDSEDDEPVQTIAQPTFKSAAARARFVNRELSEGDFERLWLGAFMLNRSPSADPKALSYGTASPSSDET